MLKLDTFLSLAPQFEVTQNSRVLYVSGLIEGVDRLQKEKDTVEMRMRRGGSWVRCDRGLVLLPESAQGDRGKKYAAYAGTHKSARELSNDENDDGVERQIRSRSGEPSCQARHQISQRKSFSTFLQLIDRSQYTLLYEEEDTHRNVLLGFSWDGLSYIRKIFIERFQRVLDPWKSHIPSGSS